MVIKKVHYLIKLFLKFVKLYLRYKEISIMMNIYIAFTTFYVMNYLKGKKMLRMLIPLLMILILFISCSTEPKLSDGFGYLPETVSPGEEVTIFYNPDSTILAGEDSIQCLAYLFNKDLINTVDVTLKAEKKYLKGTVQTNDSTFGLILKFKSDDLTDNNQKAGYVIYLKDKNGKQLPGSLAGYAVAINSWGAYYLDLDRNKDKALQLFDEEFKNNPDQKNNFLQPYFNVVYAVKNKDSDVIINDDLANLGKKENKTEEDYTILAAWYSKLGEDKKAIEYEKIISEKYPMSEYIQSKKYSEFRQLVDVNDKINFLKEFEKNYPESQYIEPMYDIITNYYRDTKDYKKAFDFLTENQNKVSTFRFYSVADRMLKEDADYDLAFQIINLGELRNREEVTSPKGEKPNYYSESEWLQDRRYMLGLTLFVEAQLLNKMGDEHNECLALSEEAVNLTRGRETDINIFYAKILVKDGEYDKAISKIGEFYKTGFSSPKMKEYLLEAYIGQKGSDAGFEDFAAKFESAGNEKLNQKLKKDLISEPAPDFTLFDLDGRKISLSELKGKVVVLDFWATWCGPCLASFPGMKKAVEIYQDDSNVKFLFVNTWERVDNVKQNAIDFIKKNNYPFHVLLDDKNEVIEKYKVSGIPTKFIIDKNSNIRFMNVGFEGSDDQLVLELSAMISMVQ